MYIPVCLQETQFERAGGTVCMSSLSIWYRFNDLVQAKESCPRTKWITNPKHCGGGSDCGEIEGPSSVVCWGWV